MTIQQKKQVLVVAYSQTGTTQHLADSICAPLEAHPDIQVTRTTLCPARPYPFPWRFLTFFDTFPETVQLDPPKLNPLNLNAENRYDLVMLAYPVWFLSPAPPMTAFLRSAIGRQLLADTPVITVIGCRNMWVNAHQTVRRLLEAAGARHCDNVVVTDRGPSLATFITTPRWFLTGRNDRFLGLPPAGISDADINQAARFGRAIVHAFESDRVDGRRALLSGLRAVTINAALVASERIGYRSFHIWSRVLRRCGPPGTALRRGVLLIYCLFLVTMIITVVPVIMLIRGLLHRLGHHPAEATLNQYAAPSGEGDERMQQFQ